MTIAMARPSIVREPATRMPPATNRMALIDACGSIVAVNKDWLVLAERTGAGLNRVGPGVNYLEVCRRASSASADAREALNGINSVLKGKRPSFTMDYSCQTPSGQACFRMAVTPISDKDARVAIIHTDITDLQFSKERHSDRLQQFARRLINAQEAERLKISREIHDNLGNRIALMAFSVRQIMKQRSKNPAASMAELNKVLEDVTDLSAALRDFSHGLHPPLLRYVGISAALKSLGEEFGKALGIGMEINVPANLGRLPEEVELCIFRISQECLQNIAKHSEASSASIVLERTDGDIRLTVSDSGRGFIRSSAMEKGGLGLVSMEERALCLGGSLSVNSSPGRGTAIHVTIPLAQDSVQALTV